MPASRTCQTCGAALPSDLRWCGRCYAPVREFTPREPLHRGDFVGTPIVTGGHAPHWSRWEKSATTFGPGGRIALTALFFLTIPTSLWGGYFLWILFFPAVAPLVLGAIWAKGWVVPGEPDLPPLPVTEREDVSSPLTRAQWAFRIAMYAVGLAIVLVIAYGPLQAEAAALALSAVIGLVWFFRGFWARY